MYFRIFIFILSVCISSFFSVIPASAAYVYIDGSYTTVHVGDIVTFDVFVDTQEDTINAVDTSLLFPQQLLAFKSISTAKSQVSLWVSHPSFDGVHTIQASGITPGGFTGGRIPVYSVTFTVLATGQDVLHFQSTHILRNDGLGTDVATDATDVHISVIAGPATIQERHSTDTETPEHFTPIINRDADVYNNDAYLVFETSDKLSGIDHFEVKEGLFGLYRTATSPYRLIHQNLDRKIYVKAIDHSGNELVETIYPQNNVLLHEQNRLLISILILCTIVICFLVLHIRKKFKRQ